ncbi:MAG: magnesium transporter [Bacilli bacterium]|nr:magnesium transporter [Bacilli bacterium]
MNQKIIELLNNKEYKEVRKLVSDMNEVDIANILDELDDETRLIFFRLLPKDMAADVFSFLDQDSQSHIINAITDKELGNIMNDLFIDDAVDTIEELPAIVVKRVLRNVNASTRNLINQYLNYDENSAGSIMTAEYVTLRRNMTVKDSFDHIRKTCADKETIYDCFVLDETSHLEGVITVRELLRHPYETVVKDIMETNVIYVETSVDREEVARKFSEYDLLSMPVVDKEKRMVGIVTIDDVIDVMEEEVTEDFEKMALMTPSEKPYLKTNVFTLAKHRLLWLSILMISSIFTGLILGRYEAAFAVMPILVTFIPMLMDTGGNAGSQSSTLIIRGMATNEIRIKDIGKIVFKELRVGLITGICLAILNFVRVIIQYPGQYNVALVVSIALVVTVVCAKVIGGALPVFAKAIHIDPAIMASPLITTIVDAVSLIAYFTLAVKILGM